MVNSGIRLYFTEKLRQHELGILTLSSNSGEGSFIQIPGKTQKLKYTTICYSDCTEVIYKIALKFINICYFGHN